MSAKSFKRFAGGALAGGAAFAGVSYVIFDSVMNRNGQIFKKVADTMTAMQNKKNGKTAEVQEEVNPRIEWFNKQRYDIFEIESVRGYRLKGYFFEADEKSNVYVFMSHGYRSCGLNEFNRMAKFYHDLGYNLLMVDHQSHGESGGKYIGFGYYEYQDGLRWLDFLNGKFGNDIQIILTGVSMGSATVMMMTGSPCLPDNVKFTVADCGYTTAYEEFVHDLGMAKIPPRPILDGADFFNKLIGGYHFRDADALSAVKRAKIPMLFIHGSEDWFVPTRMGKELYLASSAPDKELVIIQGAEHAQSYDVDPENYEAAVKRFAEKYIVK